MGLTRVVTVEDMEEMEEAEEVEEAGVVYQVIMLTEARAVAEIMEEEEVAGLDSQEAHQTVLREQVEQARKGMEETQGIRLHLSLMETIFLEARAALV